MRALRNPVNIPKVLEKVAEIRRDSEIPIIFFAYTNSIFSYGLERFVDHAEESGLDGALLLDLPPEEAREYKRLMDEKSLSTIFLVSPVTPNERLKLITAIRDKILLSSTSFSYVLYSYAGGKRVWNEMQNIVIVGTIGFAILLIACFNFINLAIALNFRRYKEAGIKKLAGSNKLTIVIQFLGETFIITLISLLSAVILAGCFCRSSILCLTTIFS